LKYELRHIKIAATRTICLLRFITTQAVSFVAGYFQSNFTVTFYGWVGTMALAFLVRRIVVLGPMPDRLVAVVFICCELVQA